MNDVDYIVDELAERARLLVREQLAFHNAKEKKAMTEQQLLQRIIDAVGVKGIDAISSATPKTFRHMPKRGLLVVEALLPIGDVWMGMLDDGNVGFFNETSIIVPSQLLRCTSVAGIVAVLMVAFERQRGTLPIEAVQRETGVLSSIARALEIGGLYK